MSSKPLMRTRLAGALLSALLLPAAAQAQAPEATGPAEPVEEATLEAAEPADAPDAAGYDVAEEPTPAAADPAAQDAEMMPRASRSLLLDAIQTSAGYFVVGERGHILVSQDGKDWQQAAVPTRSTLTTIASANGVLWAGGHDGVIVHSTDGGQTWTRRRMQVWTPDYADPLDGVPVMDILMVDGMNGFAVGAYAMFLETSDGGVTWQPRGIIDYDEPEPAREPDAGADAAGGDDWTFDASDLQLEAEADPHLYAMARTDEGHIVIAGERGAFFRSTDGGQTWERDRLPYEGSMFGILSFGGGHLLVHGLRGNVLESRDLGRTWSQVETGVSTSLMGGQALPGGGAVLVGANGVVLTRPDADSPFTVIRFEMENGETPNLTGVLPAGESGFIVVGDKGAGLFRPQ